MEYTLRIKEGSVEIQDPSIKATRIFKTIREAIKFINNSKK